MIDMDIQYIYIGAKIIPADESAGIVVISRRGGAFSSFLLLWRSMPKDRLLCPEPMLLSG